MKFYPIKSSDGRVNIEDLSSQYASARIIGSVRIGDSVLFVRSGLKTYFIPYSEIRNCFRRVIGVPMKLCCGKGEMNIEKIVLSDGTTELAEVTLPGTRAALEVMKVLEGKMPDCEFGYRRPEDRRPEDRRIEDQRGAE